MYFYGVVIFLQPNHVSITQPKLTDKHKHQHSQLPKLYPALTANRQPPTAEPPVPLPIAVSHPLTTHHIAHMHIRCSLAIPSPTAPTAHGINRPLSPAHSVRRQHVAKGLIYMLTFAF
jgi:hypothetical protein